MWAIAKLRLQQHQKTNSQLPSRPRSHWQKLFTLALAIALCFYLTACGGEKSGNAKKPTSMGMGAGVTEVSPPTEIQRLSRLLDRYQPQVAIVSPKSDTILDNSTVTVKFDVKDLPIFKNSTFGLGPHIHVALDSQEYKALYDLNQTISFENLLPGTHTIRAFASRPWHESFKNEGAYAQTTFHVFTKTGENTPTPKVPLLTYSRPVGTYGAEPIMLDFYLRNAPLRLVTLEDDTVSDWQIRATLNDQSFTFDQWQPIYLKGFKSGKNWVKLELLDGAGNLIPNTFNSSAHAINYQPDGSDTLARLMRGEAIANIDSIVDPNYVPPAPVVVPPVEAVPPEPKTEEVKPELKVEPKVETKSEVKSEPIPTVTSEPLLAPVIVAPPVVSSPISKPTEPEVKKPKMEAPEAPVVKQEPKKEVTQPPVVTPETKVPETKVNEEVKVKETPEVKASPSVSPTKKPSMFDRFKRKENPKAAKPQTPAAKSPVKDEPKTEAKQIPAEVKVKEDAAEAKAKEAPAASSATPTRQPSILERYRKKELDQMVKPKPYMAPAPQMRKPIPQFVPMQDKLKKQKEEMDKPADNLAPSLSGTSQPIKVR
jgi:hypothetical protein